MLKSFTKYRVASGIPGAGGESGDPGFPVSSVFEWRFSCEIPCNVSIRVAKDRLVMMGRMVFVDLPDSLESQEREELLDQWETR